MSPSTYRLAARLGTERESIFDRINRLAETHLAINLGQGFPDFAAPQFLREALVSVARAGNEQYSRVAGEPTLRTAIAGYLSRRGGLAVDAEREVTVTCGCQEGLAAALFAVLDPGDEVVIFEPFFETYRLCAAMAGGVVRYATLRPPDFHVDEDALRKLFGPRTRAIIVNTPHNPSGHVFGRDELALIARLCIEHDVICITDEVYEELVYDGEHQRLAAFPDMRDRTITLSSLGKTFCVTGWKIGWAVAAPPLTEAIRRVHQALAFSIAKPLQLAAVAALASPNSYYEELVAGYRRRRDLLLQGLREAGFEVHQPAGSYFLLAGIAGFRRGDDSQFCEYLTRSARVAMIPSSFLYENRAEGSSLVRFAFCKTEEVLAEAIARMKLAL